MKLHRLLLAGAAVPVIGAAFGYHRLTAATKPVASASLPAKEILLPNNTLDAAPVIAEANEPAVTTTTKAVVQASAFAALLDQVIADAIQRGTLDINRLTPQQLALLPEKFRKKNNGDAPQLSEEEIEHVEQQLALGDDAPPEPQPAFPCPDPNNLPENYNNDYNKMILRERGCKLN